MPRTFKLALASLTFAVLCLASAGVAHADNIVVNGSFENPVLPPGTFQLNPTGSSFIFTGRAGIANNPPFSIFPGAPTAPDGVQYAFLQTSLGGGSFSQSTTLPSAGTYTISYLVAGRPDFGTFAGAQTYQVLLGSTLIATDMTTSSQPFTLRSFTFTATAGTFNLSFNAPAQLGRDNLAFFDTISITPNQQTTTTPEPTTMLLLGTGLAGVMAKVRKRRRVRNDS